MCFMHNVHVVHVTGSHMPHYILYVSHGVVYNTWSVSMYMYIYRYVRYTIPVQIGSHHTCKSMSAHQYTRYKAFAF